MRILFTRHGESEANIQHIISNRSLPHQLTEKGVDQAAALAEVSAAQYTSPNDFFQPDTAGCSDCCPYRQPG